MEKLLRDVRYGMRKLAKAPGFTVAAVLTLALAIGSNTAIFSIVNGALLRPLPYKDPDELMYLTGRAVTKQNIEVWKTATDLFEDIAGVDLGPRLNLESDREPERLRALYVSARFFPVLGIQPELGRFFTPEEDKRGAGPVAVVSHEFWRRHLGGEREAMGSALTLNDEKVTVVGVLPAGFRFRDYSPDVWLPLSRLPNSDVMAVARLREGVGLEQACAQLDALTGETAPGQDSGGRTVYIRPLHESMVWHVRTLLLVLLGAAGLVLLIGCANVVSLALVRGIQRQKELAVRSVLGASRTRLVSQLTVEHFLLFLMGGLLSIPFAHWTLKLLAPLSSTSLPRFHEGRVDSSVFLFALVCSSVAGLLAGVVPALTAAKFEVNETLRLGSPTANTRGQRNWMVGLVIAEVALTLTLLTGAGLLVRTFLILYPTDPGFDAGNKLTFNVDLPVYRYSQPAQWETFYGQLQERIKTLPSVVDVAAVNLLPFGGLFAGLPVRVEGSEVATADHPGRWPHYRICTPNYLRAMGIPVLRGRSFTEGGFEGRTAPVAVINQTMARRFWPNQEALGRHLFVERGDTPVKLTVVGIVGDTRLSGNDTRVRPELYVPYGFHPLPSMSLILETQSDPLRLAPLVRDVARSLDPNLPLTRVRTMEEVLASSLNRPRLNMLVVGAFAFLGLVLAVVGVYGLVSYGVSCRTREIGIRLALGAGSREILAMVLRAGLGPVLAGLAVGLLASYLTSAYLSRQLYGVTPTDPATYLAVFLLLLSVATIASYVPARRASKQNPVTALREE